MTEVDGFQVEVLSDSPPWIHSALSLEYLTWPSKCPHAMQYRVCVCVRSTRFFFHLAYMLKVFQIHKQMSLDSHTAHMGNLPVPQSTEVSPFPPQWPTHNHMGHGNERTSRGGRGADFNWDELRGDKQAAAGEFYLGRSEKCEDLCPGDGTAPQLAKLLKVAMCPWHPAC